MTSKYGEHFFSNPKGQAKHVSSLVKNIASVKNFQQLKIFDDKDFQWTLGKRDNIKFWEDNWSQAGLMSGKFERLYNLSTNKNISISEIRLSWEIIKENHRVHWRRGLRGWELNKMLLLNDTINNLSLNDREDALSWKVNDSQYSTSEGYKALQAREGQDTNFTVLWKIKVPPKVKISYGR